MALLRRSIMTYVTIIQGNIVLEDTVLYGGHVVVVKDTIFAIGDSTVAIPTADKLSRQLGGAEDVQVDLVSGGFVVPGFVDIHNHGLGGHADVLGHWCNPDFSLNELARCGTLTTLASLIFSTEHESLVQQCIAAVEARVGTYRADCALLGGIHAEGPIIHDRGGLPACCTTHSLDQFKRLCASMPSLRVMTISPHLDAMCGYERIRHLMQLGVRPSLGHDRVATKQEILGALRLATSEEDKLHTTHMCNVMSFHHRNASLVNVGLCRQFPSAPLYTGARPPTVEVIADLIHADSTTVQAILSARAATDVAVITDCISAHVPGKHVVYNGRDTVVRAEGACYLCDKFGRPSSTLAGSTCMLADLFYNLLTLFRVDLLTACQHVASVPARIARLNDVGAIAVGKRANILLLNTELNIIERRMIAGQWTSHAPYRMLRPSVAHM